MIKIKNIKNKIITIYGKHDFHINQCFLLSKKVFGYVIIAENDTAKLLVVGDTKDVKVNDVIKEVKNGNVVRLYRNFFGNVITPFGKLLTNSADGVGQLLSKSTFEGEYIDILDRKKINEPLSTGLMIIDTMISIGKGQRELIIGDRNTGKTTIATNIIINQENKIKTVYVAIGQKRSNIVALREFLNIYGVNKSTIIIYASPDNPTEQFYAPHIGISIAESIAKLGEDVLVILDDLSKHANVCREISLLLERNPGREAYPSDIFSTHSSILERGGSFNNKYRNSTITILPIVETINGDIASTIPSNLISITDGQIFTSIDKFNEGVFPAIDIPKSVSRTGSVVRHKTIREISLGLKREYIILNDLKKYNEMSIQVTDNVKKKIKKFYILEQILSQKNSDVYDNKYMFILLSLYLSGSINEETKFHNFRRIINKFSLFDKSIPNILKMIEDDTIDLSKKISYVSIVFQPILNAINGKFDSNISKHDWLNMMKGDK